MTDKRLVRVPGGRRLPPAGTDFVHIEVLSGIVLALATVTALVLANLFTAGYEDIWGHQLSIGFGDRAIELDLRHLVNEGLMTVFFFVVGLEIKREMVEGDLRDRRHAALPVVSAIGGMVLPAAVYLVVNAGGPGQPGWGIPIATDIAFAFAILSVAGPGVPRALKLFLLTLAVVDDVGAILVIAVFYSDGIEPGWLLAGVGAVTAIVAMRRLVDHPGWYVLPALGLWLCLFEAGVNATVAGVTVGLLTPAGTVGGRQVLVRLESLLHPWSSFLVVPLFALANAGVVLDRAGIEAASTGSVGRGVLLARVIGKPLGILAAAALAVHFGLARLPAGVRLRHLWGVGALSGIGFTVSLYVADAAFTGALLNEAKVAILVAAVVAASIGAVLVRATVPESWD